MCRLLESVRGKTMRNAFLIPAAIAGLAMTTLTANATPTGSILAKPEASVIVQVAEHECIRDEKGWHYMEKEHRHSCRPKRPEGRDWGWRCEGKRCGWWHAKEKRWND